MSRLATLVLAALLVLSTGSSVLAAPGSPRPAAPSRLAAPPSDRTSGEPAPRVVAGRVAVHYADATKGPGRARALGLAAARDLPAAGSGTEILDTGGRATKDVLAALHADPTVAWAEPVYVTALPGTVAAVPVSDPLSVQQYALDRMRVRDAWAIGTGGSSIVAVLDTGIQFDHPDLQGIVAYNAGEMGAGKESNGRDDDGNGKVDDWRGWNFVADTNDPTEDNVHGTWVSGIIGASHDNGIGIAGISWRDKVLPVKIMDANGTGDTADLAAGIDYAVKRGAKVINMSIAGFPYTQLVQDAIDRAWASGAVLVAAAGNNRSSSPTFPADFAHVLGVTATQADDELTNWSNYGSWVELAAPGAAVTTTNCNRCNGWGDYTAISGTSFAAPNVAGVVALMRGRFPAMTPQAIVDRLLATADDLGYAGRDDRYGYGRVNALRALGGSATPVTQSRGDALEPNNVLSRAAPIPLGVTTHPNSYPAGDVDVFRVTAPRAGRIDVAVTPVIDTTRPVKSSLPFDPVLELYDATGRLVLHVDNPTDSTAVERGSIQLAAGASATLRVTNWLPNGVRTAYTITPAFVDNVAPLVAGRAPVSGAGGVDADSGITVQFNEAVTGVSAYTMALRNAAGAVLPATVSYDAARRTATLRPRSTLPGRATLKVSLSASSIRDAAGNGFAGTSWTFATRRAAPRLGATDRYATAAVLSAARFAAGAPVAYVASGLGFADALSGGPAAAAGHGPLLLTAPTTLPAATATELARLAPGRIVVLGGPSAVSDAVMAALGSYTTGSVTRIAGADRYATAARISAATFARGVPVAYIATGESFPDALAGGAAAAHAHGPVLLTKPGSLPPATAAELIRLAPGRIVVLGGPTMISDALLAKLDTLTAGSATRLAGADRYGTAVAVSAATYPTHVTTLYVATGAAFADGLAAGPVAGLAGGPLLLVGRDTLPSVVSAEIRRLDPSTVVVVGGSGSVSEAVRSQIEGL